MCALGHPLCDTLFPRSTPTPSGFQGCAPADQSQERAEESREEGRGAREAPRGPPSWETWHHLKDGAGDTGPSQHQPGAGRTTTSRQRSGDIFPPSPAPILRAASPAPAPAPRVPGFPRPPAAARRGERAVCPGSRRPLPSLPHPLLWSLEPRPVPALRDTLPFFLPSSVPSLHLASQHRELGGGPRTGQPTPGAAPLSLRGSDSPPAPAPRCSLVRPCAAPPPPPGTRSLRAPGDGSDLSSSTSYSSGCSGAGSASLEVGGAESPTGGAVAVAAQTPSSGSGPPSGPDALAVPGFGCRTRVARVQAGREGRSGAVKLRKGLAALAISIFPSPNSRRPWSSRTLGHPTSRPSRALL